jgi:hypothetical protein
VLLTAQEKLLAEDTLRAEREHNEALREKNAAEYELETAGGRNARRRGPRF